ncbi:MAG: SOS response-associated peptidase [Candidatus Lambdaproteobacteria bacterium]|nr:SOS response-associated peptidase [Candidatus Lambdaproteobacteria bacterium]
MCGRFTATYTGEELAQLFLLPEVPRMAPRYNVAPSQPVAAVRLRQRDGQRELTYFQWGLIPSWAKDPAIGNRMINARSETVAEKPSFKHAFRRRRCLVPASGYYEWQQRPEGRQPMYIHLAGGGPFAIAALWETWMAPDGGEVQTCALLTRDANATLRDVHDRMPVILPVETYTAWLDLRLQDPAQVSTLLRTVPPEAFEYYPVSMTVNNPRNESPVCIARLG